MDLYNHYLALSTQWAAIIVAVASVLFATLSWLGNNLLSSFKNSHPTFWNIFQALLAILQVISVSHPGLRSELKDDKAN
jgi:hypothetical protein